MRTNRTAIWGGVLLAVLLAGCSGPKPEGDAKSGGEPKKTEAPKGGLKVALVLDQGGIDDKSFNAAANAGMERAKKELGLDERSKYIESKDAADYKQNLTNFANQGYDLVVAVGLLMKDAVQEVAPQFPNTKFALVDADVPNQPNCVGLMFKEEQGSFLAGYVAAAVSKKKVLGFVGGMDIPLIKKFECGYRAGAKTADPMVQVKATYTNNWDDLTKGRSQADQLFANGADIIFQAAGKGGLGVIQAAKEKGPGYFAIGVDRDQDDEAPGRVLTSMVKRVDNAVYDTIKQIKEGHFTPGAHIYDLKQEGVGLSEFKFTKQDIPADVLAKLETLKKQIADGKVVPPTTQQELDAFQPPKL